MSSSTEPSELRPLVLSLWTPPLVRPQAILIGKMIPEWKRQGVEPVIARYQDCGEWDIGLPLIGLPHRETGPGRSTPLINSVSQWLYYRRLARTLETVVREHRVNVIYSFANPMDSNLIGAMLARRTGVPYVAHFSDPWIDTPYRKFSRPVTWKIRLLERYVIRSADRVTAVDEPMCRHILDKYAEDDRARGAVIHHCFVPADYPPPAPREDTDFLISHLGVLNRERTPEVLFHALARLRQLDVGAFDRVRVRLVGAFNRYSHDYREQDLDILRKEYGIPEDMIKVQPPVSYLESLQIMRESDCLLAIDPRFTYFTLSKVIDYAGAERPIVAISPVGSPTAETVRKLGFRSFGYDEAGRLATYLRDLISGTADPRVNEHYRDQFRVERTTERLFEVFFEAIESRSEKGGSPA